MNVPYENQILKTEGGIFEKYIFNNFKLIKWLIDK
jgi:hypothetical protein